MMQSQQPITIEDIYALFRISQEELQRSPHGRTRTSRRDLPTQTAIAPHHTKHLIAYFPTKQRSPSPPTKPIAQISKSNSDVIPKN